jgi:hypothetical protein
LEQSTFILIGTTRPIESCGELLRNLSATQVFSGIQTTERHEIRRWWEERRLIYNLILFIIGIITCVLVFGVGPLAVKPGEDFEEPFMLFIGPPIYAIMANLCYTMGPMIDVTFRKNGPRVWLFKAGLIFSMLLTAAPGIWAVIAWLITVHTGRKL